MPSTEHELANLQLFYLLNKKFDQMGVLDELKFSGITTKLFNVPTGPSKLTRRGNRLFWGQGTKLADQN
jgi:hypothetical protein